MRRRTSQVHAWFLRWSRDARAPYGVSFDPSCTVAVRARADGWVTQPCIGGAGRSGGCPTNLKRATGTGCPLTVGHGFGLLVTVTQDPRTPDPHQPPTPPVAWGQPPAWPPPPSGPPFPGYYGHPPGQPPPQASGLYVAAAVINWVVLGLLVLATCGVGIVAAAWIIPMTVYIHRGARDRYKHTGLGVCTLLFCNLISGILMLAEETNRGHRSTT